MFEPTGFFYLYLYPLLSSIFAGFIFWAIFSFFPDERRKRSFGIGVFNDLMRVNNLLFQYFDIFLKHQNHSPSQFQERIHSSSISEDDFGLFLQNKILGLEFDYDPEISSRLLCIGDKLLKCRDEIDETIRRLYSFNMYLSPRQIQLLRDIQEKIFRYSLEKTAETQVGKQKLRPIDPSLSYMRKVLAELMDDHRTLRSFLFRRNRVDRTFAISKVQYLFYLGSYKQCITECNRWIKLFPFDSDLQISYQIRSLQILKKTNEAYALLEKFLQRNTDAVGFRDFYYSMISDSTAFSIILKRIPIDRIEEMKKVVEQEKVIKNSFLSSNSELKQYFSQKNLLISRST